MQISVRAPPQSTPLVVWEDLHNNWLWILPVGNIPKTARTGSSVTVLKALSRARICKASSRRPKPITWSHISTCGTCPRSCRRQRSSRLSRRCCRPTSTSISFIADWQACARLSACARNAKDRYIYRLKLESRIKCFGGMCVPHERRRFIDC